MFNIFNIYFTKGTFITNTINISANSCIYRITSVNHFVKYFFYLLEITYLYGNIQMLCQDIQWGLSHFDLHGGLDPSLKEFLIKLLLKRLSKKERPFTKSWGFCRFISLIFTLENLVKIIIPLGIALITLLNSFSFTKTPYFVIKFG